MVIIGVSTTINNDNSLYSIPSRPIRSSDIGGTIKLMSLSYWKVINKADHNLRPYPQVYR